MVFGRSGGALLAFVAPFAWSCPPLGIRRSHSIRLFILIISLYRLIAPQPDSHTRPHLCAQCALHTSPSSPIISDSPERDSLLRIRCDSRDRPPSFSNSKTKLKPGSHVNLKLFDCSNRPPAQEERKADSGRVPDVGVYDQTTGLAV